MKEVTLQPQETVLLNSQKKNTLDDAQADCKKNGGYLATIAKGSYQKKINSGYNEFDTFCLYTLPPLINSEKSNSDKAKSL